MIFVDPLMPCLPNRRWKWDRVSHLMSDDGNMEALHLTAERLGLRRAWFQDGPRPHYDLTPGMRARAVALGVTEFTREETGAVLRAYRLANQL